MKKQNKNCEKKELLQVDSIKYLFSNTILMIKQTDFFSIDGNRTKFPLGKVKN